MGEIFEDNAVWHEVDLRTTWLDCHNVWVEVSYDRAARRWCMMISTWYTSRTVKLPKSIKGEKAAEQAAIKVANRWAAAGSWR